MNKNYLHIPNDDFQKDLDEYMGYQEDTKTRYKHRQRINNISDITNKMNLNKEAKVLDIGSGYGANLALLSKKGYKIIGIELCGQHVKRCSEFLNNKSLHDNVTLIRADAMHLPFKDNTFDFIICSEVLEHLDIPFKGAMELSRVLKPGKRALISMPNLVSIHWLYNRAIIEFKNAGKKNCDEIDPHMKFPFWRISSLLKKANLDIMPLRGTYLMPSDALFKCNFLLNAAPYLVHWMNWIEWRFNIKCFNAFYFILASKT